MMSKSDTTAALLAWSVPVTTRLIKVSYMLADVPGETTWFGNGPADAIQVDAGDRIEIHIRKAATNAC